MHLIMYLGLILFSTPTWAIQKIQLELGEYLPVSQQIKKIWIEEAAQLQVQNKYNRYFIKTLKIGSSHIRLDKSLLQIDILPVGSKQTFLKWQNLQSKFVDLKIEYCGLQLCLTGELHRVQDYDKILNLMKENEAYVYMAARISPDLQTELQSKIQKILRAQAITPQKILFNTPWTFYASTLNRNTSDKLSKIGIFSEEQKNTTTLADNVKLSVKILELSNNFERKLGIRWPDSFDTQVSQTLNLSGPLALDLTLIAAEKEGRARILASPSILCRSGQESSFFAGGEFPVKIVGLKTKDVIWKKYGIGLKFKPLIDALGQMSLQVETEISTLDRSISIDDLPALHTNKVTSYFDLIESRTIAISGLIKSESSENTEGLAFLKNIPVIGPLFSSKNFQENKSKLVILVTPELFQ